jgi:hypothetical protein
MPPHAHRENLVADRPPHRRRVRKTGAMTALCARAAPVQWAAFPVGLGWINSARLWAEDDSSLCAEFSVFRFP